MARPKGPDKTGTTLYISNGVTAKVKKLCMKRSVKKIDDPNYDLPNNFSTVCEAALEMYLASEEGKMI